MPECWDDPWGSLHVLAIFVPEPSKQHLFLPVYLQIDDGDNEDVRQKKEPVGSHESERDNKSESPQIYRIPDVATASHHSFSLALHEL